MATQEETRQPEGTAGNRVCCLSESEVSVVLQVLAAEALLELNRPSKSAQWHADQQHCMALATTVRMCSRNCTQDTHPLQWTSHNASQPRRTTGCSEVPASSARAAAVRGREGPTNSESCLLTPLLLPLFCAAKDRSVCRESGAAVSSAWRLAGCEEQATAGDAHATYLTAESSMDAELTKLRT